MAEPRTPIDPTKNVLDLVAAQARYNDELRATDARFYEAMREKDRVFHVAMLEAAVKRLDDLNKQKAEFDSKQIDTLRLQVAENATILGSRIAEVEQFRYEQSGKGSGATAAIGYVIAILTAAIAVAVALFKN